MREQNLNQHHKPQKAQSMPPQKWGGFTYPGIQIEFSTLKAMHSFLLKQSLKISANNRKENHLPIQNMPTLDKHGFQGTGQQISNNFEITFCQHVKQIKNFIYEWPGKWGSSHNLLKRFKPIPFSLFD